MQYLSQKIYPLTNRIERMCMLFIVFGYLEKFGLTLIELC